MISRTYGLKGFSADLIAGLTVAVILVPQSMAYALLAGLPAVTGLYAAILPALIYGLLGSTRFLTVGPTAITSVMTLSILAGLAPVGSDHYIALAATLALFLGGIFLLLAVLRLGWIVNFLSQSVLTGYINAAALLILMSQVQHLTGIATPTTDFAPMLLIYPVMHITQINPITLLIGLTGVIVILTFRFYLDRWLKPVIRRDVLRLLIVRSAPLLVILTSTLLVYLLRPQVPIIGTIPSGLPAIQVPTTGLMDDTLALMTGAAAIAFVGFMEAISTAKTIATRERQRVDANRELIAMGAANIGAAVSGGLPVTTSISRSAVNHAAGSRSGLSSVIAAGALTVTVLFLTGVFFYLPNAALAAVVMTSVVNLLDFSRVRHIWRYSRWETLPFFVTFFGVFIFSIEIGILGGIVISLALHLYRTSQPYIAVLGRVDNTRDYQDIRHHDSARLFPRTLIIRVDESLYFANVQYLENHLRELIATYSHVTYMVLACGAVNRVDANGLQTITDVVHEFEQSGVQVLIAELKPQVYERFNRVQFVEMLGPHRFYATVNEAIYAVEDKPEISPDEYPI